MNVEQTPESATAGDKTVVTTIGMGNCFFVEGTDNLMMRVFGGHHVAGHVQAVSVRTGAISHVPEHFEVYRATTLTMVAGGDK